MSIELTKLPSGLRIITDRVSSVDSVALGVWVDVGTRHESLEHNGVAHMVEHMMFKGTPENVGGHINAYTSREITAYHIHLLKEHTALAIDLLSDIIQRPSMPDNELIKERQVILQEIGMTLDTPDDLVFDKYQNTAYPEQALGAPILGSTEIVENMPRDVLLGYVRDFYNTNRVVISASGNLQHDEIVNLVSQQFNELPQAQEFSTAPARYEGGESREDKALEQVHIVLGFKGLARLDDDFYAAMALSTILGGGMSSRLFQEIREKRGLVYAVYAFHSCYQDDGQMLIYSGTGPDKIVELVPVLCEQIKKLTQSPVSDEEINRCKEQLKSSLLMSRESMMSRANHQAKNLIHFSEVLNIKDKIEKIEKVTKEDIIRVAQRIFSSDPTLSSLGPVKNLESFDDIKERLVS
jgi:predicted Zn-dependent peptidase